MRTRLLRAATALAVAGLLVAAPGALANNYANADYRAYDADNIARTSERQGFHFTTPEYWLASNETFRDTWVNGQERQVRDAPEGRVYAGAGQHLPGGNVGDPERYYEGDRYLVEFINREGTKLVGNVWPCVGDATTACPSVVVTTGSIQVTQHMYGWLARHLQSNGYTVMTFDVRGQGESETTVAGASPFQRAANPQDAANFVNGTVDALRFLLSSEASPYVPLNGHANAGAGVAAYNPVAGKVDPNRLGLIGHSLGASAVSTVQQCTSTPAPGVALPATLPAGCAGQRFPIRAIVAYDSLNATTPMVPAFDHRADGYFVNAVPTFSAPNADERVGASSPYGRWRSGGVDACAITVRGGTHAEWSEIPYIVSATRYGVAQAKHYTLAWLDRYVSLDAARASAGFEALRAGPVPQEAPTQHLDHRASLFSGKYKSACHVSDPSGGVPFAADDLRAYAGVAGVGDWAALNAEKEHGVAAEQGALHRAAYDGGL